MEKRRGFRFERHFVDASDKSNVPCQKETSSRDLMEIFYFAQNFSFAMNPLRTVQTALRFRTVTHAAFPLRLFPASFRGYITAAVDTPRPGSIPEEYASAPKGYSRTRREWTKEESDLLMRLANNRQMSWRTIASHFQNRSPSSCHTRYRLLISKREDDYQGPWTPEEMHKLRELTEGKTTADEIDWEEVQIALPRRRRLVYIKLAWEHSVNPKLKFGRWSDDEIERLRKMVQLYGINNWDAVAEGVGTRTKRQCLERWRWQQAADIHKGRYRYRESEHEKDGVNDD